MKKYICLGFLLALAFAASAEKLDDFERMSKRGVTCGGHFAASCKDCTKGNGPTWCNGDCKWNSSTKKCQKKATTTTKTTTTTTTTTTKAKTKATTKATTMATTTARTKPKENRGSMADGCPKHGRLLKAINMPSKAAKGAVRCCSKNGQTCVTPKPCMTTTLAMAQARCARMGRRLCTANELAMNKCCATGCGFDNRLTWKTGKSKVNKQAKKSRGLADGCPRQGKSPRSKEVPSRSKMLAKGAVRCCSKNGKTCVTPKLCMMMPWSMAQAMCSAIGRRICTAEELAMNKCCSTGCGFDSRLTWHTGKAGKKNQGIPKRLLKKKPCKNKYGRRCNGWQRQGFCTGHYGSWMRKNCKKACKKC